MIKLDVINYLVEETSIMMKDLPEIEEYRLKAGKLIKEWFEKHNNYNLTYDDAWKKVWGTKPIPTKAKIKANLKKIRELSLEIDRSL